MRKKLRRLFSDQSGTVIVVTAICLFMIIGVACVAIDLGHLYLVKSELQRAADAAAISGTRALFPFPVGSESDDATHPHVAGCPEPSRLRIRNVAKANHIDGSIPGGEPQRITVGTIPSGDGIDIGYDFGFWDFTSSSTFPYQTTPTCSDVTPAPPGLFTNAVVVTIKRDNIPLIFLGVLNFGGAGSGVTLSATAVAAKGFVAGIQPGCGFPLAVWQSEAYVRNGLRIELNNDPTDNGAWWDKTQSTSAADLKGYLDNPASMPQVNIGQTIYMQNGVDSAVLRTAKQDGYEGDYVYLPVVGGPKGSQSGPVISFAAFKITNIKSTGNPKYIEGNIVPNTEMPAYCSTPGGTSGLLTSTRLVQ